VPFSVSGAQAFVGLASGDFHDMILAFENYFFVDTGSGSRSPP
jgi:hypothetical protein